MSFIVSCQSVCHIAYLLVDHLHRDFYCFAMMEDQTHNMSKEDELLLAELGLLSTAKVISFTDDCLSNLPSEWYHDIFSPYVVVKDTPPDLERAGHPSGTLQYIETRNLLILKMVNFPHELISTKLCFYLNQKFEAMGLADILVPIASTRQNPVEGQSKSPNGGFRFWSWKCPGDNAQLAELPRLVIEVSTTEAGLKLEKDIKLWLERPEPPNRFGISVDLRRTGNIYVKLWKTGGSGPGLLSQICIEKGPDMQVKRIIGKTPVIPFEELLAAPPDPSKGQADIELTNDFLETMAVFAWKAMKEEEESRQDKQTKGLPK